MQRTRLEFVWEVDQPSLGFAERVVATATGEAFEIVDRPSGMVRKFAHPASPAESRGLRRTLAAAAVVAAAASVLCLFGSPTTSPGRLTDFRAAASGGNTANNPEAGATGLW